MNFTINQLNLLRLGTNINKHDIRVENVIKNIKTVKALFQLLG